MTSRRAPDPRARVGAASSPREAYERLLAERPGLTAGAPDGVRIATEPDEIARIETEMGARYEARSWPRAWAEVGVHYADPYLMMLRDAVVFPDGSVGIHHRVLTYGEEPSGVAVLPVIDGKILLIRHFRHPLRAWSLEVPRGARDPGESAVDAARRELREEIGATLGRVVSVGRLSGAGGICAMVVELMVAEALSFGDAALAEGIAEVRLVTVADFERLAAGGEIVDAFTIGCFFHARLHGHL